VADRATPRPSSARPPRSGRGGRGLDRGSRGMAAAAVVAGESLGSCSPRSSVYVYCLTTVTCKRCQRVSNTACALTAINCVIAMPSETHQKGVSPKARPSGLETPQNQPPSANAAIQAGTRGQEDAKRNTILAAWQSPFTRRAVSKTQGPPRCRTWQALGSPQPPVH
jgi:hypothetical protein